MAFTIAQANGWNHLISYLTAGTYQQDRAREAGALLTAAAAKTLLAGLRVDEFESEIWPRLLRLRSALIAVEEFDRSDAEQCPACNAMNDPCPYHVGLGEGLADAGVIDTDEDRPELVYGVSHPEVITVPITSWSVATATRTALPDDAELVVRLIDDTEWLRYDDGAPIEVRRR